MASIQFLSISLLLLIFSLKAVKPQVTLGGISSCQTNLGVEFGGQIPDSQLTASSSYAHSVYHGPANARLNRPSTEQTGDTTGSWSAQTNDLNQWIQAGLGKTTWVTGVKIQGRNACCQQWVTKFKVQYSNDGVFWKFVQQPNKLGDMIFDGSTDQETVVSVTFPTPVTASFVRIRPTAWNQHISMRFEVVGCEANICQDPAGLENGQITDSKITASTEFAHAVYHGASNARLNRVAKSGTTGSWSAQTNDINQWIQAELNDQTWVTGILIQGRADDCCPQWVTKFKVQYSVDGIYWNYVTPISSGEDQVFDGGYDQNTAVLALFPVPVKASFVKIRPTAWNGHISMRFEVLSCNC